MYPNKTDSIRSWSQPATGRQIQVILGFANCYRHFVSSFAPVLANLSDLTQKDRPFRSFH